MARFNIYRYQLLPIEQGAQLSLFDNQTLTTAQLRQRKNEFFAKAVTEVDSFESPRAELVHRLELYSDELIVIRIAVNRRQRIETKDFETRQVDDWPSLLVVINNDPNIQLMAIEVESRGFRKTQTVAGILQSGFNASLQKYSLHMSIMPIFDKADFWEVVDEYRNQITQVKFEMVSPNMSSIAESLKLDLHALHDLTNTQETTLELTSDKNASLTLPKDNEFLNSLVDYSANGGGNISVKARGVKKTIRTSDSVKEFEIGDLEISANDTEQLAAAVKLIDRTMRE